MIDPEVECCDGCGLWFALGTLHPFVVGKSTKGHMLGGKVSLCTRCATAVRAARPKRAAKGADQRQ